MQTIMRYTLKLTAALLLVAAMFGSGLSPVRTAAAACSPAVSFDLWAKTGTANLYGSTNVTIWGYAANSADPAGLPGPVLDVPAGTCVGVTLHNGLSETTSLLFQGQDMIPDLTGVAPGGDNSLSPYTFIASKPGTYLYEAGLIPGAQHQVAMGLYGALIVRPNTAGQAYDSASTAYDQESVLVLSEFDTALYTSPNTPATFDMRKFAPKYFLINGKAYPGTTNVSVTAGNDVLLRYVNAGLQAHAMSLLGFAQTVIAQDGSPFAYPHKMAAETIAPGQTLDTLITAPTTVDDGSKFALYDANMLLRNNTGAGTSGGLGGMLTFLSVMGGSSSSGPDTTGPLLSSLTLAPNPNDGTVSVALSFTANDTMTGNNNVTAAEYWIDSDPAVAIPVGSPAPVVSLNATIPSGLSAGTHVVSVRAQDAALNWSTTSTINLVVDNVGPTTGNLSLSPNPSSGAVSVNLSFKADDSASGNSNVTAAEYFIDPVGTPAPGTGTAVTVGSPAPVKTLNATIASGLSAGTHVISVRSKDAVNNWGALASVNFVVDNVGPSATSVSAVPNPNNGTQAFNTSVQAVRIYASFSDASSGGSNLATAEGFLDAPGTTGTGFVFIANDGIFNSPAEGGFYDLPLVVVNALSSGPHPICVHAKDAVGNWGATDCSYNLTIVPPTVSSIAVIGSNFTNAASVQFLVTFSESVTGVTSGNFTVVRTGLSGTTSITSVTGSGATRVVTVSTGSGNGTLGLNMTSATGVVDSGGHALTGLPFTGQVYTVDRSAPTFSSISLSSSSILAGTASVTLTVNGSADTGGSGVAGGEYWICSPTCTNPAAGGGTAFSGLSVSVPTNLLAGGHQYTIRARIRDNAGNWSTGGSGIRSTTLTVIPANNIFTNGFEAGNTSGWSSSSGTTSVNTASALFGANGMQVAGNNANYVQSNLASATATYDARFYFRPNGNNSSGKDIFSAATSSGFGTTVFRVRYRLSGGQTQVQIQVGTSNTNTTWTNVTSGLSNTIEVTWQASGNLQLYVNGVLAQTLTASANNVGAVRLGSVTSTGNNTAMYFDAFTSKSTVSPLLGP